MRQYRIITKTPETDQIQLEPITHAALYNIPEVREAIDFIHLQDKVEMVGIRIGGRYYSIIVVYADELLEGHFKFDQALDKPETLDQSRVMESILSKWERQHA